MSLNRDCTVFSTQHEFLKVQLTLSHLNFFFKWKKLALSDHLILTIFWSKQTKKLISPVPVTYKNSSTTAKFYAKSLKQSRNIFVWNLLHKFVFVVSQIVCKLGKKIYSMQKKPSRNPLSRNLAISKKILLKQFQEKKTTIILRSGFLPLFHGLWSIQTSVEQRRTSAKWGYSLLNSCIFFSIFFFISTKMWKSIFSWFTYSFIK